MCTQSSEPEFSVGSRDPTENSPEHSLPARKQTSRSSPDPFDPSECRAPILSPTDHLADTSRRNT
jgi:hypothetical protein